MSAIIHLARHGQTEWHAENRYAGTSDVSLTDVGRQQADALGRWASTAGLSAVVSSDLERAVETARIVGEAARLPRYVEPTLRESHFGRGEGLTRSEMALEFPDELAAFIRAPATHPLPDGEPGALAARRFIAALERLADEDVAPRLVIAHTTVIRLALCQVLGLPLDRYRSVFPSLVNASVSTLSMSASPQGAEWALLRFNAPIAL